MTATVSAVVAAYQAWKSGKGAFTALECRLEDLVDAEREKEPAASFPTSPLLTTTQAARLLGVSPRTAAKLFDAGHLSGWRVGRDRRIVAATVQAYQRRGAIKETA